jgi:hypothetical protein
VKLAKLLGLTLAAVLVLSAATASVASAKKFQSTIYPVHLKAEKVGADHAFTIGAFSVTCKNPLLTGGPFSEAKEEIEVTPDYKGCFYSGVGATVAMEGCKYRINANTTKVDLACPGTSKMRITSFNLSGECEVQIAGQNGLEKIEYTNNAGPPKTITVKASVEKIKYKVTLSNGLCPLKMGEEGEGKYTGEFVAKGWDAKEQNQYGVFVE